jgi:hypothetical protein
VENDSKLLIDMITRSCIIGGTIFPFLLGLFASIWLLIGKSKFATLAEEKQMW